MMGSIAAGAAKGTIQVGVSDRTGFTAKKTGRLVGWEIGVAVVLDHSDEEIPPRTGPRGPKCQYIKLRTGPKHEVRPSHLTCFVAHLAGPRVVGGNITTHLTSAVRADIRSIGR